MKLVRCISRISDQWINELFQDHALAEIKLSDADEANLNLTVPLPRVVHVEHLVKLLELRVVKAFKSQSELDWSMIATVHLVQASIEFGAHLTRHIILEQTSVAVAGSLIFLVNIEHFITTHLVAG